MTVDDLVKHYDVKNDTELVPLLGKSKGTISLWRKDGIPAPQQAIIQIRTDGKLVADLSDLEVTENEEA